MKRHLVTVALALMLVFTMAGTSMALLCLEADSHCDAYAFAFENLGDGLYGLNGYGYGCYDNQSAFGTLRAAGGLALFGITSTHDQAALDGYGAGLGVIHELITVTLQQPYQGGPETGTALSAMFRWDQLATDVQESTAVMGGTVEGDTFSMLRNCGVPAIGGNGMPSRSEQLVLP